MPSRSEFRHLRTLARLLFPPTFCPVSCVSESAPETYKSDHAIYAPSRLRGHKLATFRFKLPAAREIISFDRLNTSGERRSILLGDNAGCEDEHSIAERIVGNIRHCFVDKVIQPRIMILFEFYLRFKLIQVIVTLKLKLKRLRFLFARLFYLFAIRELLVAIFEILGIK